MKNKVLEADIVVYGGTSAGVIAAYSAKKMGKKVILVEPGKHLGGMSSGGLGYTDIGNKYVVTGLSRDFYRRIGQHYGKFEQWIFEPKVAEGIFNDYAKKGGFTILFKHRLKEVKKTADQIHEIVVEDSYAPAAENIVIRAKVYIDCSYEGDLMARSGVSYTVGREANSEYNETLNGVELMDGHQFPDGIDPYIVPGDSTSGLLYGIGNTALQAQGSADKKVQAYNFRIALSNVPENRVPITQPENYDAKKYELLLRLKEKRPWKTLSDVMIWSKMPNGKTDINNRGGFSTDMIGENWDYPEASYEKRAKIWKNHEDYTKGFLYFIGNDPRIPAAIRAEMKEWGYPKDEYVDNGNWTPQLYIREARRMIGELVMTQHHCQGKELVKDGVAMAAYTMDSHNCDRHVVSGMVKNEGNVEVGGFGPYPIAYRAIVPKKNEVSNLIVPVCLSATHIAYGSIRMEPVFMVLAQSSAIAASLAVDQNISVQDVDVAKIQQILKSNPLLDGSTPEILVDNENSESIKLTGNWFTETKGGYGPSFLIDTTGMASEKAVQFIPQIVKDGKYLVYAYFPKLKNASSKTSIQIFNNGKAAEHTIDHAKTLIEGQTSGEWVPLGAHNFKKGKGGYVQISNKNTDGTSIADAVLFVPEKSK
ncbi:FAD-dependent oxidoreductase [Pedobacter immunditicola]|uniref:FAD-dependent oxidoreductase n=1 Tax=Pedobacter immunditicola TaxID=3133440 RepID=UPI0030AB6E02